MAQLPPIVGEPLPTPHFPTQAQCLIYRLWNIISPTRLAAVLHTDVNTVLSAASDMGLTTDADEHTYDNWLQKGYITIIRAVWHLLNYDQIMQLLDWDEEKLAFILHEDDFLDIKLGENKPYCEPIYWRALSKREKEQTAEIRDITVQALKQLPPVKRQPFSFEQLFAQRAAEANAHCSATKNNHTTTPARFDKRIIYSYCALYGDTFFDQNLIDQSFPDELLSAYQALGINGIWTQAVLYTLCPYPFDPARSEGYEQRLAGVRYLIEKLNKYDMKLYLYLNEPRPMPNSFFEKYPHLRGAEENGFSALCMSQPEVRSYLENGAEYLVSHAPGLGGFFTITASENLTNCYAHYDGVACRCPRCASMQPADMYALVNKLLLQGARRADPEFCLIAWSWGWWVDGTVPAVIDRLPQDIEMMGVSEQKVEKTIGEVRTHVEDYSISIEGPGSFALDTWKRAHARGMKTLAKIQVNNSWEMAAVPCIPVFEKIYRHVSRLFEENCVDSLMLSWTLGGYPSPTLQMLHAFYEKSETPPTLEQLYVRCFGKELATRCAPAFHTLSEAFDAFPFHIDVAYHAPQHYAPANLLYATPMGRNATMVGFPYDDLDGWRSLYSIDTFVNQLKQLSDGWHNGTVQLQQVLDETNGTDNPTLKEILDCAVVCDNHFRSMYLQCLFVLWREKYDCSDILREECDIALREASVMADNPTIGYESSNHYFYTRTALLEKVLNCTYLLQQSQQFARPPHSETI